MSFDIYITAFENEDTFEFPVTELRKRFAGHIRDDATVPWSIGFREGFGESEIYFEGGEMIHGFAVSRPPDSLEFWEIIAGILRDLPCALYWPTTTEIAVMGSLDLLPHLPKDFIRTMGVPLVSTDPERIRQYVRENS